MGLGINLPVSRPESPAQYGLALEGIYLIVNAQTVVRQFNGSMVPDTLPIPVAGSARLSTARARQRLHIFCFQPCTKQEPAQTRHLITVIELNGVMGRSAREVIQPRLLRVVAVGARITQPVLPPYP